MISFLSNVAVKRSNFFLLVSIYTLLLCNSISLEVRAATKNNPDESNASSTEELGDIEVVGVRASLRSAQQIKRDKIEITDSIVAEDIHKLPDFSITDALQRVTGVQITRERGDGNKVAIRGLTQMETTLNGREIFSVNDAENFGRSLNFAGIPAEAVSSINVYKTSSANHIEGGVGGLIDLRTHRPFDFKGKKVVGSAQGIYGDLVDDAGPQFSTLLSNRWQTHNWGEVGALLNFSWQQRRYREDKKDTGNPFTRTDIIPGQTVFVNSGTSEYTNVGYRERTGANLVLQWSPIPELELYAEGSYLNFETTEDTHQINVAVTDTTTFVAGTPTLFSGTNDLKSITWTNASMSELSFIRDTKDETKQAAIGGTWYADALTIKTDLSYTHSINDLVFFGPFLSTTAANFTQDMSTDIPSTSVTGTDLSDPANYALSGLAYVNRPFEGEMYAAQVDGEYLLSNNFFESLSSGFRIVERNATNEPGQVSDFSAGTLSPSAAAAQGLITSYPYDYFPGSGVSSINNFLISNLDDARDIEAYRSAFGITTPLSLVANPVSLWNIDEQTIAGYVMTTFAISQLPIDGNVGLRVVNTRESVSGHQSDPIGGGTVPLNIDKSYIDYLPSMNLRYDFGKGLYLRAGASKTLTRQKFSNLSPSLTLFRNVVTPSLSTGSAGNPDLDPVRSDNLDIALEKYFNPHTSIYVTGFMKQVDGFVTSVSNPETYDGVTYQVTRPQNTGEADIKGFEVGYQQFYDFLPGWWSGLGLQANYTYVDSEDTSIIAGQTLPLQDLSEHSYNLIGMYERGPVSIRIAYNWRDEFLSGITNIVGVGSVPLFTEAYGWLDASARYHVNDQLSLAIQGTNLLGTQRDSNYNSDTRHRRSEINDIQLSFTMTLQF